MILGLGRNNPTRSGPARPAAKSLNNNYLYITVYAQDWFSHDPTMIDDLDNDGNALTNVLDILTEK